MNIENIENAIKDDITKANFIAFLNELVQNLKEVKFNSVITEDNIEFVYDDEVRQADAFKPQYPYTLDPEYVQTSTNKIRCSMWESDKDFDKNLYLVITPNEISIHAEKGFEGWDANGDDAYRTFKTVKEENYKAFSDLFRIRGFVPEGTPIFSDKVYLYIAKTMKLYDTPEVIRKYDLSYKVNYYDNKIRSERKNLNVDAFLRYSKETLTAELELESMKPNPLNFRIKEYKKDIELLDKDSKAFLEKHLLSFINPIYGKEDPNRVRAGYILKQTKTGWNLYEAIAQRTSLIDGTEGTKYSLSSIASGSEMIMERNSYVSLPRVKKETEFSYCMQEKFITDLEKEQLLYSELVDDVLTITSDHLYEKVAVFDDQELYSKWCEDKEYDSELADEEFDKNYEDICHTYIDYAMNDGDIYVALKIEDDGLHAYACNKGCWYINNMGTEIEIPLTQTEKEILSTKYKKELKELEELKEDIELD